MCKGSRKNESSIVGVCARSLKRVFNAALWFTTVLILMNQLEQEINSAAIFIAVFYAGVGLL